MATAGTSLVAVAGVGTTLYMTAAAATALEVAYSSITVLIAAAASAAVAAAIDEAYRKSPRNYTVYCLIDPTTKVVEYVGRTRDPIAREKAHKNNPLRSHLEFNIVFEGLNELEARGLEQILIAYYGTLNKLNPANNQINGIRENNPNGSLYMGAAYNFLKHLGDRLSNEILNWLGK